MEHSPPSLQPQDVAIASLAVDTVRQQQLPSSWAESPSQYLVDYSSQISAGAELEPEPVHVPAPPELADVAGDVLKVRP